MAFIKELKKINPVYMKNIVELHRKAFPSFFLTQLGASFLQTLYSGYMEDIRLSCWIILRKRFLAVGMSHLVP